MINIKEEIMTRTYTLVYEDDNTQEKELLSLNIEDDGTGEMELNSSLLKPFEYEELSKILRAAAEEVDKHKND